MRCLVQRVRNASVSVDGIERSAIDEGLLILAGIGNEDSERELLAMSRKIVHLRIFEDAEGKFQHSLLEVGGAALVVSQFTLFADLRRGRRPSFSEAARGEIAEPMIDRFAAHLVREGVSVVKTGVFGAAMDVSLCNRGPVTIWLDSDHFSRN